MPVAEAPHALTGILSGLTGFSRVAVAVSGGSDSMALLQLVTQWRTMPFGPKSIFALTVDHGLRAESANEANQVAAWCAALGVPHQVLMWQGEKPKTGIQAKARVARYDVMTCWCRDNSVPVLLTGHTADDQAETVMMRQQRTTSDRSLAAIWPENEWRGVKLFRPLLNQRRHILRDYLNSLGHGWLEDPSNLNIDFERVRIRSEMQEQDVPVLQVIAQTAQLRVREADTELRQWRQEFVGVDDYAVLRVPRPVFSRAAIGLQCDVMSWALQVAGDGQLPERGVVLAICQWIAEGRESRRSVNGAIVSARRHVIEAMREPGRLSSRFQTVGPEGRVVFDGRFCVTAPEGALVGAMGVPPLLKRPKDVPALAFSALPVVKLPENQTVSAVKSGLRGVSATLCERFVL